MKLARSFLTISMLTLSTGVFTLSASAQEKPNPAPGKPAQTNVQNNRGGYVGFGTGLDYGGIGIKVEAVPVPFLGIFFGMGHNGSTITLGGGLSLKPLPKAKLTPVAQVMYGYNGLIVLSRDVKRTYYGFSAGAGLELKVGKHANKLYAGLMAPILSNKYQKEYNTYHDRYGEFDHLAPLILSLGFAFHIR